MTNTVYFVDIIVNIKVLIINPMRATHTTLKTRQNMLIIQNGRHDVIDKHINHVRTCTILFDHFFKINMKVLIVQIQWVRRAKM